MESKKNNKPKFSKTHPHLLSEWDWDYNNSIGVYPDKITYGSNKKVGWICSKGHKWDAIIASRTIGENGCKYCSNQAVGYGNDLATLYPNLAKEWHPTKNILGPEKYVPGSNKIVWWVCSKCKNEWESSPNSRSGKGKKGCPFCVGQKTDPKKSFGSLFPNLLSQWDYEKNKISPFSLLPGSHQQAWFICDKGHSYKSIIYNRTIYNKGCKYCCGQAKCYDNYLSTTHPHLECEWSSKNKIKITDVSRGSNVLVLWECNICSWEWEAIVRDRAIKGNNCPKCSKNKSWSKIANEWLDKLGVSKDKREVSVNCKLFSKRKFKVDALDDNVIYEFFGDYWHGNINGAFGKKYKPTEKIINILKKRLERTNKRLEALIESGFNIIYVWESDYKRDIMISGIIFAKHKITI